MAINYTRLAATAERLIRENGRVVTLRKRNDTPPDANEPWNPSPDDTLTDVRAVIAPHEEEDEEGQRTRYGEAEAIIAENAAPGLELETYSDLIDGVRTTNTLTLAAAPGNDETVVVGARTYTFKTALTPAANEVLIGASASASIDNLIAAINGGAGSGTLYGAGTMVNADFAAAAGAGDTMTLRSKVIGTLKNGIMLSETLAAAGSAWDAAATSGGSQSQNARVWRLMKPGLVAPGPTRVCYIFNLTRG